MSLTEELELVPPENRREVEEVYKMINAHPEEQYRIAEAQAHIEAAREMCRGMGRKDVPTVEVRCGAASNSFEYQKRLVYVTFYTHSDKKVVQMHLDDRHCLKQVTQKAAELLPSVQWKICSGTQHQADFEFLNSRQVWDSIKFSPICRFYYLLVRLERLPPVKTHDANCDNCRNVLISTFVRAVKDDLCIGSTQC